MDDKEQRWQTEADRFSAVTDKLGKSIDQGILDTVIILNILGIHTSGSCEGHLEWGTCAPWVTLEAPDAAELDKASEEAFDRADQVDNEDNDDADELYDEAHRLRLQAKSLHLAERQKLLLYLERFYQDRLVPYDRRLIVYPLDEAGAGRLESQGADFQETAPLEKRQQKLLEYQEEMREFTAFLKQIFFADE